VTPHGHAPLEEIHRAFLHKRSTLTSVLERLEGRKRIERITSERDRRRFDIRLTKTGRSKAASVKRLFDEITRSAAASETQRKAAAELLAKIARTQEAVD
jgi:DNA-binding MarR family transcriptional regulator